MIHISKLDDLNFSVRFDPEMASELSDASRWGTVEDALCRILSDALLVPDDYDNLHFDTDEDVPF